VVSIPWGGLAGAYTPVVMKIGGTASNYLRRPPILYNGPRRGSESRIKPHMVAVRMQRYTDSTPRVFIRCTQFAGQVDP